MLITMAITSRAERNRRRESALTLVSEGKGFSDVVTAQMAQWGCSRSSAQRDCRWAHNQLQLGFESLAAAKAAYDAREYQEMLKLRQPHSKVSLSIIEEGDHAGH